MPTFRAGFPLPFDFAPQLEELRDELDRVWTTLSAPLAARAGEPGFPPVNVRETDDAITVEAELPGLESSDLDISVADDALVLKGSRPEGGPQPAAGDGERKPTVTWHRRERGTGAFERRIPLPVAVDAGRVEAQLVNGVLTVTCPKAPQCQPHKVVVRAG